MGKISMYMFVPRVFGSSDKNGTVKILTIEDIGDLKPVTIACENLGAVYAT